MKSYYSLRWQVLERDNFTCQYCGQYAPNVLLEVDHVTSVADGGTDDLDNLKTSCWACNHGKEFALCGLRSKKPTHKMTPYRQNGMLEIIAQENGVSTTELQQRLFISRTNADTILYRLRVKGLIVRRQEKWYLTK